MRQNGVRPLPARDGGFTVIDLIVVMAIAGLIMTGTFNALNQLLPRFRVKQAATELAGAVRAARSRAIQDNVQVVMPIDPNNGRYAVVGRGSAGNVQIRTIGGIPRRIAKLPTGVEFTIPGGGTPVQIEPPGTGMTGVQFNARGRLMTDVKPGRIYVGNPKAGVYYQLGVDLAGNVRLKRWDGNGWV